MTRRVGGSWQPPHMTNGPKTETRLTPAPSILATFPDRRAIDVSMTETALLELLSAVQDDQIPPDARSAMHDFYDRYLVRRNHFLHHFAPYICEADQLFEISKQRPHLLDLGCGVATQAHLFGIRGARITGLDNDPQRVHAGEAMRLWFAERSHSEIGVDLHATDAFQWLSNCEPESFDGCYTQFALAYMRPHRRMLELIDRVVRPGGLILFREFNAGSLYNRLVSRVDWLTDRDYRGLGRELGWSCQRLRFDWLLPWQLNELGSARRLLGPVEEALTHVTPLGRVVAASMTLVFQREP